MVHMHVRRGRSAQGPRATFPAQRPRSSMGIKETTERLRRMGGNRRPLPPPPACRRRRRAWRSGSHLEHLLELVGAHVGEGVVCERLKLFRCRRQLHRRQPRAPCTKPARRVKHVLAAQCAPNKGGAAAGADTVGGGGGGGEARRAATSRAGAGAVLPRPVHRKVNLPSRPS